MICPKCNQENSEGSIYCNNCNGFLNIAKIKELFQQAKNYIKEKKFFDAAVILLDCLKLTKDTEFEKQFETNLKLIKSKLTKNPDFIKEKVQEIISLENEKDNEKAKKMWKILLELSLLPDTANEKIKKRIAILEGTIYPKQESVRKEKLSAPKKKGRKKIIFRYFTGLGIIAISIYIILRLLTAHTSLLNNKPIASLLNKNRGGTGLIQKNIVSMKEDKEKEKDMIFVEKINGDKIYYNYKGVQNQINEWTTISVFPVILTVQSGMLEIKFNNHKIAIKIFENSELEINYETDIMLDFHKGKFYLNTSENKLIARTNSSEFMLTENAYLLNITQNKDEIVIGDYPSKYGYIINKKFPKDKKELISKSLVSINSDSPIEVIPNIDKQSFYENLILWKYNLIK